MLKVQYFEQEGLKEAVSEKAHDSQKGRHHKPSVRWPTSDSLRPIHTTLLFKRSVVWWPKNKKNLKT